MKGALEMINNENLGKLKFMLLYLDLIEINYFETFFDFGL